MLAANADDPTTRLLRAACEITGMEGTGRPAVAETRGSVSIHRTPGIKKASSFIVDELVGWFTDELQCSVVSEPVGRSQAMAESRHTGTGDTGEAPPNHLFQNRRP